jgi:GDP-4-dehydro-6-deoxy-D-mannose reductase
MRVLVTGGCGFAGRHAAAALRAAGHEPVAGDVREEADVRLDLCERASVEAALAEARPDAVLHLGGLAFVPQAWADPQLAFAVNTVGTLNVLDAVRRSGRGIRVVAVTSAEVYGAGGVEPTDEDAPLRPANLYGVTKAAADAGARRYAEHFGLDVVVARPANHIGPGQHASFVTSAFARQLKAIAAGGAEPAMRVGNLDQTRDFTDVRDVVRAYVLLLEKGQSGEAYNIAGGCFTTIREVLEGLMDVAGVRPRVEVDPALFRPTDRPPLLDVSRIWRDAGWRAEIPLAQSLRDLYAALPG